MTGKYKILSVFTAFIFLILPPTGLSGKEPTSGDELNNPISPSVRASGNAAVYYQKAFDLLKYPDSKKLDNEINEIIKDGFIKKRSGAVKIIEAQEEEAKSIPKMTGRGDTGL